MNADAPPRRSALPWGHAVAAALTLTLLNAVKPVVVDDPAYLAFAEHLRHHPDDPYGFEIYWYRQPQAALHVLMPPVLPYWLALGMELVGSEPFFWKLWLLPFALMLSGSILALADWAAPQARRELLWLILLGPTVLPAFNFMLDLPALALGLTGTALFLTRPTTPSFGRAGVCGVLIGLALQTKYTAVVFPALFLVAGLVTGRLRAALISCTVAATLFLGWEAFLRHEYGESHFLYHLARSRQTAEAVEAQGFGRKVGLLIALVVLIGSLAPTIGLIAALGLGLRRTAAGLITFLVLGWALLAIVPPEDAVLLRAAENGAERLTLSTILFGLFGLGTVVLVGLLLRHRRAALREPTTVLLLAWLTLELGAYFVLSPFAAARRFLGISCAALLLVGRFTPAGTDLLRIVLAGIALGLLFALTDLLDAQVERRAVEEITARFPDPAPTVFVGHWGWQFYAKQAGWQFLLPNRHRLDTGTRLILPIDLPRPLRPKIDLRDAPVERIETLEWAGHGPFRTIGDLYGGSLPIRRHEGPRLRVGVYRTTAPWTPQLEPE